MKARFSLHEDGELMLESTWSLHKNKEVVMPLHLIKDFVNCLRRDWSFSDKIKSLATEANKIKHNTAFTEMVQLVIRHIPHTPHFLKTTCIKLLISLSVSNMGHCKTATWCATNTEHVWPLFLKICEH